MGSSTNRVSVHIRKAPETLLSSFSAIEDTVRRQPSELKESFFTDTEPAGTLMLDFQSPEL